MENLSNEELMRRIKYKHGTFDADEAESELLDRLNRLAEAESRLEKLKYTVRLANGWLTEYIKDSDNATHAKRILQNEIIGWQFDNLIREEHK